MTVIIIGEMTEAVTVAATVIGEMTETETVTATVTEEATAAGKETVPAAVRKSSFRTDPLAVFPTRTPVVARIRMNKVQRLRKRQKGVSLTLSE